MVPECRIDMYGGSVVASEVGDEKREIVYFGDTINTATRLEQMCQQWKRAFLVSGELRSRMSLSSDIFTEELGTMELRRKQQQVRILSLWRAA